MSITLKKAQQETIEVHGERAYPHEGCGLLVGRLMGGRKVIEEVRPLENAREHSRENRYLIPPAEIVKAERAARERGRAVLGFFHSHPDAPARPSPYDLEHASWPSYSYVIVSVKKGSAGELRSWVLRDDRSQFDPEEIVVQPEEIQPEEGVIHER